MSFNERADWSEGSIAYSSGPMSLSELEGRATYLFGDEWIAALSKRFNLHPKTVRRWRFGAISIPGPAAAALRALWMVKRFGLEG